MGHHWAGGGGCVLSANGSNIQSCPSTLHALHSFWLHAGCTVYRAWLTCHAAHLHPFLSASFRFPILFCRWWVIDGFIFEEHIPDWGWYESLEVHHSFRQAPREKRSTWQYLNSDPFRKTRQKLGWGNLLHVDFHHLVGDPPATSARELWIFRSKKEPRGSACPKAAQIKLQGNRRAWAGRSPQISYSVLVRQMSHQCSQSCWLLHQNVSNLGRLVCSERLHVALLWTHQARLFPRDPASIWSHRHMRGSCRLGPTGWRPQTLEKLSSLRNRGQRRLTWRIAAPLWGVSGLIIKAPILCCSCFRNPVGKTKQGSSLQRQLTVLLGQHWKLFLGWGRLLWGAHWLRHNRLHLRCLVGRVKLNPSLLSHLQPLEAGRKQGLRLWQTVHADSSRMKGSTSKLKSTKTSI